MKCYFAFDEKAGKKVLIPGCWSVVNSNDISDCNCNSNHDLTYAQFEKVQYNKVLDSKNEEIKSLREEKKYLEKEVIRLNRRIEILHNKRKK